jgi:hypothetical protein
VFNADSLRNTVFSIHIYGSYGGGGGTAIVSTPANRCVDVPNASQANGTQVALWDCNGGANQRWSVNSNGTITNQAGGLCLDAEAGGTANGTASVVNLSRNDSGNSAY